MTDRPLSIRALLWTVLASAPGSTKSDRARWELEHELMGLLRRRGLRSVERAIKHAKPRLPLSLRREKGVRIWSARDDTAGGDLRIGVTNTGPVKSTSVMWTPVPPPPSPAESRTHALQTRFYDRYMSIVGIAYADPPGRLSRADKLILTIGEFEADVNNGGFSQFLSNKGRRRAGATVRALEQIQAPRTAAMLSTALAHSQDDARLGKLDTRFYKVPEDLAVRTMMALGLTTPEAPEGDRPTKRAGPAGSWRRRRRRA
jgi:hypothetical protein